MIIGEHAAIKGLIVAGIVICGGKVNATMTATEKVQLLKTAIVIGDVRTPLLGMEEGARKFPTLAGCAGGTPAPRRGLRQLHGSPS